MKSDTETESQFSEQSTPVELNSQSLSNDLSSSEIEFDVKVENNLNINDLDIFLEQSRIFTSCKSLEKAIVQYITIRSGDMILSFLLLLRYEKLLKTIPKNLKKTINKAIELNLENLISGEHDEGKRRKEDQVEKVKRKLIMIYTERACELEPSVILEVYKKMKIEDDTIYLMLSKLEQLDKNQKEHAFKDFSDFDKEHLDFLPTRIEEIFLLNTANFFKMTKINNKDYRMFFLISKEIKMFIKSLENEIK